MNSENKSFAVSQIFKKIALSKLFIAAVCTVLAYTVIGFFLVPYLFKRQLTQFVTQDLQRKIQIQEVRLNPYKLTLSMQGLDIKEQSGKPLFAFSELFVNFETSSLLRWAWTFAEIRFDEPKLNFQIDRKGNFNVAQLVNTLLEEDEEKKEETNSSAPPRLVIQKFLIKNGQIDFEDLQGAKPADVKLKSLNLEFTDLSTLPEHEGPYTITAQTPEGSALQWKGSISLNPIESNGTLKINGIKATSLWEFAYNHVNCDVTGGNIDFETRYSFSYREQKPQLLMDGIRTRITDFNLKPRNDAEIVLRINEALLKDTRFDLAAQKLMLGNLRLQGGKVIAHVDPLGILNWQQLFSPPEAQDQVQKLPKSQEQVEPWQVTLNAVDVGGFSVHYSDASRLRPIELSISDQTINLSGTVRLSAQETQTVLQNISVNLADIDLKESTDTDPLLHINSVNVSGGQVDMQQRSISAEQIQVKSGALRVNIDPQHNINWVQLAGARDSGLVKERTAKALKQAKKEGKPWAFAVASLRLTDFSADVSDQSTEPQAALTLQDIDVELADVTNNPDRPIRFDAEFIIKEGGRFSSKGEIYAFRPSLDANLEWNQLALTPLQPYMNEYTELIITSGQLNGTGRLRYKEPSVNSQLIYEGGMSLTDLSLLESETRQPFLGWNNFEAPKISLTIKPNDLKIDEIRIVEPEGKLIIFKDKSVNLSKIIKRSDPQQVSPAAVDKEEQDEVKEPGFPATIKRVRVEKGKLDFADLSLILPFSAQIHNLNGVVSGITSKKQTRTALKFEGRVDEYGLARVEGSLMPFDPKSYTDIAMSFRNVEMTSLTPYTATFAGYQIVSGKLSLELQYKIQSHKLLGKNAILIDQLFLGERVKSPEALDLPLDFAIALLKDQDGKIDMNIPIRGNLDNPEFSYSKLVLKAIGNLITNIVVAPFKFIGDMLGIEDSELDTIEFDPGSNRLLPSEQEKLKHIAEAMKKRPQLRLEVQGQFDAKKDGAALKSFALKLELSKRLEMEIKPGEDPGPIDLADPKNQIALESLFTDHTSPETLANLRADYDKAVAEKKEATKSTDAQSEPLPGEFHQQLYTRLEQQWPLDENAPAALARSRAEMILQEVTKTGDVEAVKVVIKDPGSAGKSSKKVIPSKLNFGVYQ